MKFEITGKDNGKHVVKFEDGSVKHVTDAELARLEGRPEPVEEVATNSQEVSILTKDRDEWKTKAETAEKKVTDLEGKLTKEQEAHAKTTEKVTKLEANRDEWKTKAETAQSSLKAAQDELMKLKGN